MLQPWTICLWQLGTKLCKNTLVVIGLMHVYWSSDIMPSFIAQMRSRHTQADTTTNNDNDQQQQQPTANNQQQLLTTISIADALAKLAKLKEQGVISES
jgi:hypothetical protein